MLTLVGLGLCDGTDLTRRGADAVKNAAHVYLEGYTSLLQCSHEELEHELKCTITLLARKNVEREIEPILELAREKNVVILVIGDPFAATTHMDLFLRARAGNIPVHVVHNASVLTAVGFAGLDLYKYGRTVSIPYWQEGYEPVSFLERIIANKEQGLHTLCLLDIQADKDRFMTVQEGLALLQKAEEKTGKSVLDSLVVGVARVGCPDQMIRAGTVEELLPVEFGKPPQCVIIPGRLHEVEEEMLDSWK